jgi:fructokinase
VVVVVQWVFGSAIEALKMIVVCGEALMDVSPGEDTPTGMTLDARIGGSPFNVAVGLARMRQPVAFYSAISKGSMGERLMRALKLEGVDTASVARVAAPTTVSMVELDAAGVPNYRFHGNGCADTMLGADTLAGVPEAAAYHFGSYAMVVEPTASTLLALARRESTRALIAYDPNIRVNVEPRIERWRQVLLAMLPHTHLLKISAEDLELLAPGLDPYAAAGEWIDCGVSLVVITRGREGALAWTPSHHVVSHARPATVVDTVGAGDTFQAALLTALAERQALTQMALRKLSAAGLGEVMAFAATAAAITCSRRGADMPRRSEVDPLSGPRGLAAA